MTVTVEQPKQHNVKRNAPFIILAMASLVGAVMFEWSFTGLLWGGALGAFWVSFIRIKK